jgi:thiamine biosynthesis protein ThiS
MKMEVNVNGDRVEVPENATIEQLLGQLDLNTRAIAVEVNEQLQPRDTHGTFVLNQDDRLEIVTLVGGG